MVAEPSSNTGAGPARIAAFFDVDRTLLRGSSMLALARPLHRAGMLPVRQLVRAARHQLSFSRKGFSDAEIEQAVAIAGEAVRGLDATRVRNVAREAIPLHILPRVYDEAWRLIEAHRRAGHAVFLVSSSPMELIEGLGGHLGVDGVIASIAETRDGTYTGRLLRFCHAAGKAAAVRELAASHDLDLSSSYAYGDSLSDLPMLETVGHPVCVNADTRLGAVARERGWPEISFAQRAIRARRSEIRHLRVVVRRARALTGRIPTAPRRLRARVATSTRPLRQL